ncbi:MAG TPA: hypothetical protein VK501_24790 [Baekduia sp.]|uniref:hypothetical protein n=1 Tax=Baekduia sp. TaxID=2600305 RepID=UPI002C540507|nr:hypothetical protein [Baekduia sp.]HMJ37146.1 hypothetical protein [Baekduia sp.]
MAYESDGTLGELFDVEHLAHELMADMADMAGAAMTHRARSLAPVGKSGLPGRAPGTLRDSYRQTPVRREQNVRPGVDGYVSGVVSHDIVAQWMESGIRAHVIRGPVRFRTVGGRWVTVRNVQHPGVAPRWIVLRAAGETEAAFEELTQPAVARFKAGFEANAERMRRRRW